MKVSVGGVEIEVRAGSNHRTLVGPSDVDMNIEALQRVLEGKQQCRDFVLICDTISILESIKKELGK